MVNIAIDVSSMQVNLQSYSPGGINSSSSSWYLLYALSIITVIIFLYIILKMND